MIRAEHISKSFAGREVIKDISAVFEPGQTNLIIGKSGSGKTVFLKCLVGLLEIDEGQIYYNDMLFHRTRFRGKEGDQETDGDALPGKCPLRLDDR